ncbi:MAG TPA: MBL fold metallo-hydrolase [Solirubrobacteraceae bacterium]|nr:MBL fold metallo-hydrolase [Solirubrobacteraceae bacterium]
MSDRLDIRSFTVGPVQENTYIVRPAGSARALLIDPGEEPERLRRAIEELDAKIEAILITHCHFDHIGAVAPLARATGAPVYCPEIERPVLADIMRFVPFEGFGPYESYEADHTLAGGEQLSLAGLDIDVLFTPGHSPGHLTYAIAPAAAAGEAGTPSGAVGGAGAGAGGSDAARARALLSGDVLFQGSVGRTDLPGADWPTLERSLAQLVDSFPPETVVHPGHMSATTLARELATNPFLEQLRAPRQPEPVPAAPLRSPDGR